MITTNRDVNLTKREICEDLRYWGTAYGVKDGNVLLCNI